MKTIHKILMLSLAVALAACQSDDILTAVEETPQTLSFTATIGQPTRVAYAGGEDNENNPQINLIWEVNDIVTLKEAGVNRAIFKVTKVEGGVATFTCSDPSQITNPKHLIAGTTLEYTAPGGDDTRVQKANNDLAHLKAGNSIVASLAEGTDLTAENETVTFTSTNSLAVTKVTFTAPVAISKGTQVIIKGAWDTEENVAKKSRFVTLDFDIASGTDVTAYVLTEAGEYSNLDFYLNDVNLLNYYHLASSKTGTIELGKLYTAAIGSNFQAIEKSTSADIDFGNGTGISGGHEWVDLGIRLSDTKTLEAGEADKRLAIATMNIGATTIDAPGYYFRWGEQEGWTLDDSDNSNPKAVHHLKKSDGTYENKEFTGDQYKTIFTNTTIDNLTKPCNWPLYEGAIASDARVLESFQGETDKEYTKTDGSIVPDYTKGNDATTTYYGDAARYNWGGGWMMMDKAFGENLKQSDIITTTPRQNDTSARGWNENYFLFENKNLGTKLYIYKNDVVTYNSGEGKNKLAQNSDFTICMWSSTPDYRTDKSTKTCRGHFFGVDYSSYKFSSGGNYSNSSLFLGMPIRPIIALDL